MPASKKPRYTTDPGQFTSERSQRVDSETERDHPELDKKKYLKELAKAPEKQRRKKPA